MEAPTIALCDFAADYQGRLCITGAFDTIAAASFPAVHPHCTVAIRLVVRDEDRGGHKLEIHFVDPDGRNLIPANQAPTIVFTVESFPPDVFFRSQNFIVHVQGLPLREPGLYEMRVLVDDRPMGSLPVQFTRMSGQG